MTACANMNCDAGYIATQTGALTNSHGCVQCTAGTWSAGGATISCKQMNCLMGQIATLDAATTAIEGCA